MTEYEFEQWFAEMDLGWLEPVRATLKADLQKKGAI